VLPLDWDELAPHAKSVIDLYRRICWLTQEQLRTGMNLSGQASKQSRPRPGKQGPKGRKRPRMPTLPGQLSGATMERILKGERPCTLPGLKEIARVLGIHPWHALTVQPGGDLLDGGVVWLPALVGRNGA